MKISKNNIATVQLYTKIYVLTLFLTCLISVLIGRMVNMVSWKEITEILPKFLLVVTISFFGIVMLRELKWFKLTDRDDVARGLYPIGILIGLLASALFCKFSGMVNADVTAYSFFALSLIFAIVHPRYSIAANLTVAGATILFFAPQAAYFVILGTASISTVVGTLVRLIYRKDWSNSIKEQQA